jgi:hypothetical protein
MKDTACRKQPVSLLSGQKSVLRTCTLDKRVESLEMKLLEADDTKWMDVIFKYYLQEEVNKVYPYFSLIFHSILVIYFKSFLLPCFGTIGAHFVRNKKPCTGVLTVRNTVYGY